MKSVDDIVDALHKLYPGDRNGQIILALMDYANADNLKSVSFDDALYFYENLANDWINNNPSPYFY